jgi:hypothetical protein
MDVVCISLPKLLSLVCLHYSLLQEFVGRKVKKCSSQKKLRIVASLAVTSRVQKWFHTDVDVVQDDVKTVTRVNFTLVVFRKKVIRSTHQRDFGASKLA